MEKTNFKVDIAAKVQEEAIYQTIMLALHMRLKEHHEIIIFQKQRCGKYSQYRYLSIIVTFSVQE